MKNNKPSHIKLYGKPEEPTSDYCGPDYLVVKGGEVLFANPCRAICNSFIASNAIQGARPILSAL